MRRVEILVTQVIDQAYYDSCFNRICGRYADTVVVDLQILDTFSRRVVVLHD